MNDFEGRIELAKQVGKLRGAIKGCLYVYGDVLPGEVCRDLQRVLEETEDEPVDFLVKEKESSSEGLRH